VAGVDGIVNNFDQRTIANETSINSLEDAISGGTVGLVQQDATTRTITVAAGTDGELVDFANNAGTARRLTGVAAGDAATDGVNVGQLSQQLTNVYEQLREDMQQAGVLNLAYYQAHAGPEGAPYLGALAQGDRSIAMGQEATTNTAAARSVAVGADTVAAHADSVALGANAFTTRGAQSGYSAFGLAPAQDSVGEVALGTSAGARQITGVAAGLEDTDAVNVMQLRGMSEILGSGMASALGGGASYDAATGEFSGPNYTVGGQTVSNIGDAISNVDSRTTANENRLDDHEGRIAANTTNINNLRQDIDSGNVGLVQQDSTSRNITVAAGTDGNVVDFTGTDGERRLTGVAPGEVSATSTDAINGSQLHGVSQSVASALGGDSVVNPDGTISAPNWQIGGQTYQDIGSAFGAIDGLIADLEGGGGSDPEHLGANTDLAPAAATGQESAALGGGSVASGDHTAAIGSGAQAGADGGTAVGSHAAASGTNSSAFGRDSVASGANSTALGSGANASHANSTAIGAGAVTTRDNQVAIGTASNTYTMAGITSEASRAAQGTPVGVVTSDAQGNLATMNLDDFFTPVTELSRGVDRAQEGVAMAIALGGVHLPAGKTFAVSMNYGNFSGHNALGFGAIGHVRENLYLNGGIGIGLSSGAVAGRVGATLAW
jgi:autotransporter adhesin